MSKKNIIVLIGCLIVVLVTFVMGILFSMPDNKIILTLSSTLTNSFKKVEINKGSTFLLDNYSETAEGFEFLGWYSSPLLEEKIDEDFIFTANKTLYAGYSKIINVNEIDTITESNYKSYTIISSNESEKVDGLHIKRLLNLGVKRIDLSKSYLKNQELSENMFANSNISEVVFGNNIVTIGESCFENCYSLKNIKLSDSVRNINKNAFKKCINLKNIELNNGLLEIQTDAFFGCNELEYIKLPSSVNNLYNNFVSNTIKLKSIHVEGENTYYRSIDGVLYSYDMKSLIKCPERKSGEIIIDENTENIEDYAFLNSFVKSIIFSKNIKNIGNYSFYNCQNLKNIQVSSIYNYTVGKNCFDNCKNLESVSFGAGLIFIDNYAFRNNNNLKNITILENNGFEYFGDNVFENCSKLELINIPGSTKNIGKNCFYNCQGLSSLILGENITQIQNRVFYNCKNLEQLNILGEIVYIGDSAFFNCEKLTKIENLNNVKAIGTSAFYNNKNIEELSLNSIENVSDYVFMNCVGLKNISLLNVKQIGISSFENCEGLKNINIGDKLELLENNSFYNANNIKFSIVDNDYFVIMNNCVMSKDKKVIYYVNSSETFDQVTIPQEVEEINNDAFSGKLYLKNIFVDSNNINFDDIDGILVDKTQKELLAYPAGRTEKIFTVPENFEKIKSNSINSPFIEELIVGDNIVNIENGALKLNNLKTLTIPFIGTENFTSEQRWISSIFGGGKDNIESNVDNGLFLPTTLKIIHITNERIIPEYAFYKARNIETIYINSDVTRISDYAFSGCSSLTQIILNGEIEYIGSYAFEHCSNISLIELQYNPTLIISKTALSSLSRNVKIRVISSPDIVIDITAKKSYKNKFFGAFYNSRQWQWLFLN